MRLDEMPDGFTSQTERLRDALQEEKLRRLRLENQIAAQRELIETLHQRVQNLRGALLDAVEGVDPDKMDMRLRRRIARVMQGLPKSS